MRDSRVVFGASVASAVFYVRPSHCPCAVPVEKFPDFQVGAAASDGGVVSGAFQPVRDVRDAPIKLPDALSADRKNDGSSLPDARGGGLRAPIRRTRRGTLGVRGGFQQGGGRARGVPIDVKKEGITWGVAKDGHGVRGGHVSACGSDEESDGLFFAERLFFREGTVVQLFAALCFSVLFSTRVRWL